MGKRKEYIGLRFGRLLVVSDAGNGAYGNSLWECLCDCGKTVYRNSCYLAAKCSKSCGCIRREANDISGRRFGRLTVSEFSYYDNRGAANWLCLCDCGSHHLPQASALKNGTCKSCGCGMRKPESYVDVECEQCGAVFKRHKGAISNRVFCDQKCKSNWVSENLVGERGYNYKGGQCKHPPSRKSRYYTQWRREVFKRDDFTCQMCGDVGGKLNAHHIMPYRSYKKLRLDVNNGVALCKKCHRSFHSLYGIKDFDRACLDKFLESTPVT